MSREYQHNTDGQSWSLRLLPILILLLAFLLRVYQLDKQALTGDEAFSVVMWTRSSLNYLFTTLQSIDPQPPAALLTFYSWVRLVGDTEFAARMLSVLANTFTVAIAYAITHRIANKSTALLAMLLCAINPFQVWHAQDLRPYSLWMAISALSAYMVLVTTDKPSHLSKWAFFIITAIVGIYTYYLEAFVLIAQNIYFAYRAYKYPPLITAWLLSQAVIFAAVTPWLLQPAVRNSSYQPTAEMPDIGNAIQSITLGNTLPITTNLPHYGQFIALGIVVVGLIVVWMEKPKKTSVFLTSYAIMPMILLASLALITQKGYFRPRYISASSLSIILVIALFIEHIRSTKHIAPALRIISATIISAFILTLNFIGLTNYYYNPTFAKAPNWRDLVSALQKQTTPTDILIFNYPDPALTYYFQGPAETIVLPTTPNPPQESMSGLIATLANRHSYLWFIPVYVQSWDGQQVIAKNLANQTQLISEQWIDQTHLYQYASWDIKPNQITTPVQIEFKDLVTLEGYRATPPVPSWQPGTTTYIEVFWRPQQRTENDLTIFFHLLGPTQNNGSPLWGQDDYPPQDGHTSTTTWTPGALIRDTYKIAVPADAPPGTYTIALGFYDPNTNVRYPFSASAQTEPDSATLLSFTIRSPK